MFISEEVFMNAFMNTWQCIRIRIRIHCHLGVFAFIFAFIENGTIRIRIRIHFECIHPIPGDSTHVSLHKHQNEKKNVLQK